MLRSLASGPELAELSKRLPIGEPVLRVTLRNLFETAKADVGLPEDELGEPFGEDACVPRITMAWSNCE